MGIPHLAKMLQPYAVPIVFEPQSSPTEESAEQRRAVIDGPALAHHAYYIALSQCVSSEKPLGAIPTYTEVCTVVVDWLSMLHRHGVTVAAVCFDGKLPYAKRHVRQARLEQYLHQLAMFHSLHPAGISHAAQVVDDKTRAASLFSARPVPPHLKLLPPAPFLVPAVIDALSSSVYADITYMVPGEADTFCAKDVHAKGGFVITSDSDLLVHSLGTRGGVTFFSDFSLEHHLTTRIYTPADIAGRLQLANISQLAFIVSRNKGKNLNECTALAKNLQHADEAFKTFSKEYTYDTSDITRSLDGLSLRSATPRTLMLDPRVSEYTLQDQFKKPVMYLPFLFDDPTRFSAWACGAEIRRLGYSIFHSKRQEGDLVLSEVQRRGNGRIGGVLVICLTRVELLSNAAQLMSDLKTWRAKFIEAPDFIFWRSYAVMIVTRGLENLGKPLPSTQDFMELMAAKPADISWPSAHFRACLHAVGYSLRMLKQFIEANEHESEEVGTYREEEEAVRGLQVMIGSIPNIVRLFEGNQHDQDIEKYAHKICECLGLSDKGNDQDPVQASAKITRRRAPTERSVSKSIQEPNRYATLHGVD